jgi:hypothetical protein
MRLGFLDTADGVIIFVASILCLASVALGVSLIRNHRVFLSIPVFLFAGLCGLVVWFFSTFHMKMF